MKDYYYILGVTKDTSDEEIKRAYRKLSLKFHPDKNDGDVFFVERFKEIHEAYEILNNPVKRSNYDKQKNNNSSSPKSNNHSNFSPEIEFFKAHKKTFIIDEEITFSWSAINADKANIYPFGDVPPIGQKTYKLKDYKSKYLTFELVVENTNIKRKTSSKISLINNTYEDLYQYFKPIIIKETVNQNEPINVNNEPPINNTDLGSNQKEISKVLVSLILFAGIESFSSLFSSLFNNYLGQFMNNGLIDEFQFYYTQNSIFTVLDILSIVFFVSSIFLVKNKFAKNCLILFTIIRIFAFSIFYFYNP